MAETLNQVRAVLLAAGHPESTEAGDIGTSLLTTGFFVVASGEAVIVTPCIGDDVEGHPDSPGFRVMEERMTAGYRASLEAAGWLVDDRRTGLAVSPAATA